jgi:hypothetical protein
MRFNGEDTKEALRGKMVVFLASPLNFSLDLLPYVREGIFVVYATIALNISVALATVAAQFPEGLLSHVASLLNGHEKK